MFAVGKLAVHDNAREEQHGCRLLFKKNRIVLQMPANALSARGSTSVLEHPHNMHNRDKRHTWLLNAAWPLWKLLHAR
jgi:hypothetical protein